MIGKLEVITCNGVARPGRPTRKMRAMTPLAPRPMYSRRPAGFTLIELLVVIAIIGVLSLLLLGVAAMAAENAREARTKSMITRLHTLVMQQYDSYKDRRAPVSQTVIDSIKSSTLNSANRGRAMAEARLYATRELMLMEMPDRWSDIWGTALPGSSSSDPSTVAAQLPSYVVPIYLTPLTGNVGYGGVTPLNEAYRRQYASLVGQINANTGAPNTLADVWSNEGAECLYMMVMIATADGEARSLFSENSIGDTDGDGAKEFLDGWGNPISFLRWAPGYDSDRQLSVPEILRITSSSSAAAIAAVQGDHDPFDPFHVDDYVDTRTQSPRGFRLVPLIFSAGSDERYDLYTARQTTVWQNSSAGFGKYVSNYYQLTPFNPVTSSKGDFYLGTPMNEAGDAADANGGADNITNHNITGE